MSLILVSVWRASESTRLPIEECAHSAIKWLKLDRFAKLNKVIPISITFENDTKMLKVQKNYPNDVDSFDVGRTSKIPDENCIFSSPIESIEYIKRLIIKQYTDTFLRRAFSS